jgi:hypothetical protein
MAGALAELRNAGLGFAYPEVDPERVRVVLVEMTVVGDHYLGDRGQGPRRRVEMGAAAGARRADPGRA